MKRLAPFVLASLLVAACGDSIESNPPSPAGVAGTESGGATPGSEPADSLAVTSDEPAETEPAVNEPAPTDPPGTEPADTDPAVNEPAPTDPPATDPSEPTDLAVPTASVVRFFAGNGEPGFPWVPLGAWDGSSWLPYDFDESGELVALPTPEISSVVVSSLDLPDGPESVIAGLSLGAEQPFCVGEETGPLIELPIPIPDSAASVGYDAIAVTADWELQPRPVRQVGVEAPVYAEIGTALFADLVETAADGTVLQAVRSDLDGDGVEEVIVTYERQEAADFGGEGDFTGVYVRYPSPDGSVVDELISSYVSSDPTDFPTPGRFTIAAVADLNGDGSMEVMVRNRFWESGGMAVYSLVDGRLVDVAGGGCSI